MRREWYPEGARRRFDPPAVGDLVAIDYMGATPKCKTPRVVSPCVEVTIDGTPTNPES